MGEPSDRIFFEQTPIEPEPERVERVAIDQLVLGATGIRSVVLCNTMIYGNALGVPARSVQIPALVDQASVRCRAIHRPRPEPLVERAYRRRGGCIYAGRGQGAGRELHVRREWGGSVGRSRESNRDAA